MLLGCLLNTSTHTDKMLSYCTRENQCQHSRRPHEISLWLVSVPWDHSHPGHGHSPHAYAGHMRVIHSVVSIAIVFSSGLLHIHSGQKVGSHPWIFLPTCLPYRMMFQILLLLSDCISVLALLGQSWAVAHNISMSSYIWLYSMHTDIVCLICFMHFPLSSRYSLNSL